MALTETPEAALGAFAPDFTLPDASGTMVSRDAARGPNGLVVAFICNHCPYVKAVASRLAADARALDALGVGVVGIMPNDFITHPEDAPAHMPAFAAEHGITFPYLVDESQAIARAYGAVCTPDFFGYDNDLRLAYRGRLDAGRLDPPPPDAPRELVDAMRAAVDGRASTAAVHPSMGCSIKWRDA